MLIHIGNRRTGYMPYYKGDNNMAKRINPFVSTAAAAAFVLFGAITAHAGEYPERSIELIVPFPPGGAVDTISRSLGEKLSERLDQSVVVLNKTGAGGVVGTRAGAIAKPDGYTMTAASLNFLTMPTVVKDPGFDIQKDFDPISLVGNFPLVLVVGPEVKEKTLKDIIERAKKEPEAYTIGCGSIGGGAHLAAELFKQRAGIDMMTIPYKGAALMNVDLIGGRLSMSFAHITSIIEQIRGGRVRPVAISAASRSPLLPDVPTMAEEGFPDFTVGEVVFMVTNANAPKPAIAKLNKEITAILNDKDERAKIESQGGEVVASSPEELRDYMDKNAKLFSEILKNAGVEPQ